MESCMIICFGVLVLIISNHFSLTSSKSLLFNLTTDEQALIAFQNSIISNPNSLFLKTNWSIHAPICGWIGVSCGAEHRRVTALNLRAYGLRGTIPPHLGNLTFLRSLDIGSNNFTGSLPSELSKLHRLQEMRIGANNFTGEIPSWLGSLPQLRRMQLYSNRFSGRIPSSLFNNNSRLRALDLDDNKLTGSIPDNIFNVSSLLSISLGINSLSGKIPKDMCSNTPKLKNFTVYSNQLDGEIPRNIVKCRELEILQLQVNNFNTNIPPEIGSLSMLKYLYLWGNQFKGSIPNQLWNLTSLRVLVLQSNNLTDLCYECSNAIKKKIFNLYDNRLSGSIPATVGDLKKLGRLSLSANQLQGSIPIELCQITSLAELFLRNNEIHGPIPDCLGELRSLRQIYFNSNKLNSTIPSSFWNLADLVFLNLSSNYLSGEISSRIKNLKAINEIDISSNLFSGDIPSSIEGCQSLEYLTLSNNEFGGFIPESLGKMRGLRSLDLSNNNISGLIPESLQDLKALQYLNLSYNRQEGEIPDGGVFGNFTAQSFAHNSALCGAARFEVPPCLDLDKGSKSENIARLIKYVLPPLASMVVVVIIVVFLIRKQKHVKVPIPIDNRVGESWRITSYIELSRATNSFSETNLLGRGSFGSVFKGTFLDGLDIAVKVFNLELEGANKSFETESRILSTIRHRNLVGIIGCCTNLDFKALILQLMPNGSLEKWLYSNNYCMDILQLLNISIDVASALEYLHHGSTLPIVHCDIKPGNVLLDEDMTARVADFGIAKLFEQGEAMIQTKTLATIGYAAPEYGSEGKISTGADVYSFGIMLLEMFTRRKPTDDKFDGEMSLKDWVGEALQNNAINQVLAADLLSKEDGCFVAKDKCAASVFDLAMKCLALSPDQRITMSEAAATLKKIKSKVVTKRSQQHAVTIT